MTGRTIRNVLINQTGPRPLVGLTLPPGSTTTTKRGAQATAEEGHFFTYTFFGGANWSPFGAGAAFFTAARLTTFFGTSVDAMLL